MISFNRTEGLNPEAKEEAKMFKVGDIVKYSPKFCGPGEEKYIHQILEINEATGNILIATLNTLLTLGATEVVKEEMIERIEK